MSCNAAANILKEADDIKLRINAECDLLNNNESWIDQQKLQTIYHKALILDLEYSLDKKVEQDLWNIGVKNHISCLLELTRDKKNPKRSEVQAMLTWCLVESSGFYLSLLQDLCNIFDVNLPFRRKGSVYGQAINSIEPATMPQTSSCLYICQYCLVHLGDISRYRNERKQAESFYKQAILVSPTSGQPYNQLALLETSQGNNLSTVFYYIMGISVKNPFPASTPNLMKTLSSAIDRQDSPVERIQTKLTVNEFLQMFLSTHGYLHTNTELEEAEICIKSLNTTMTALVATQSFSKVALIKMTVINLYSLRHTLGSNNLNKTDDLTIDEMKSMQLTLELIAGSLSGFLVPVHTLNMDATLLDYYALPAVKLLMNFIQNEPDVLKNKVFTTRLQIWPSLCKLLNNVQKHLKALNYRKYKKMPLPEDKNLQGFLPFGKNFKDLNFKAELNDVKKENLVRVKRIVEFSLWLTELDFDGSKFITKTEVTKGEFNFEPGCIQPDPTNALLEEMKSFSMDERKGQERKGGILKPQGSLEKAREERELNEDPPFSLLTGSRIDLKNAKRGKQNVALQSIYKKMEENKQVKFSVDEEKPLNPQDFGQPPMRTQSFNQNHPAFPVTANNPVNNDYMGGLRMNAPQVPPNMMDKGTNFLPPSTIYPHYMNKPQYTPQHPPQRPPLQFQSVQYPPSYKEPPSYWPNQPSPRYTFHPTFNNFLGKPDFSKPPPPPPQQPPPPPQQQPGHLSGDVFASAIWNAYPVGAQAQAHYDQQMSMRQAMLKEVNVPTIGPRFPPNLPPHPQDKFMPVQQTQGPPQPGGYSLFDTNSWNVALPGQLKGSPKLNESVNNNNHHLGYESLFTGSQGPQSLMQLLEQQKKD